MIGFGLNLYELRKYLIEKNVSFWCKLYKNHGELWNLFMEFCEECKH